MGAPGARSAASTHGPCSDPQQPGAGALGELATQVGKVGTPTVFAETYDSASFPRDALGRVKRKVETIHLGSNTWDYSYDLAGRLETVLLDGAAYESYTYDGNGNRLSVVKPSGTTTATYDDQDRLLTNGAWTYTYTANGELLTKTNSSNGEAWAYEYDVFGNLKEVTVPGGTVIEYLVDGQNRRVGKKRNGALVKQWLYRDQLHPVAELDGSGNLVARFVWASGKNSPDLVIAGGVTYRVFTDQLSSPRVLVNVSTGAVAGVMQHDAWGVVLDDSVSTLMPFGFAGGLYDAETGLVRFGARDYDPSVGRWTNKDPLKFDSRDAPNLYLYVNGDPINFADPRGKQAVPLPWWGPILGGAAGGAAIGSAAGGVGAIPGALIGACVAALVFTKGDSSEDDEDCNASLSNCLDSDVSGPSGRFGYDVCRDCWNRCKAEGRWPTRSYEGRACR